MANPTQLAIQIAERLEDQIKEWQDTFNIDLEVEKVVHPDRLLTMIEKLIHKAEQDEWPDTKLHRWLGWIMGCMACHNIAGIEKLEQIVTSSKMCFGEKADEELEAHHNPDSSFRLDIGGEG